MYEVVEQLIQRLDPDMRELFEERAGIAEFEDGLHRDEAESYALLDLMRNHPGALVGVVVLQVQVGDDLAWLVTSDREGSRRVAEFCGRAARYVDLGDVIRERFGGAAKLVEWPPGAPVA